MTIRLAVSPLPLLILLAASVVVATTAAGSSELRAILAAPNADGVAITLIAGESATSEHPFFRSLGSGGRACATCHVPSQGWTLVPADVQRRFDASAGLDPLFQPHDAAVSPRADVESVEARRRAYALLLSRGLIRVGRPLPAGADFELAAVDDPYRFASAAELSLFRRPLPATNVRFLTTVTWDGRASHGARAIVNDLLAQASDAANTHAPGTALDDEQRRLIVTFERALLTAQAHDRRVGALDGERALGGPRALAEQPFQFAINSFLDQTGRPPTRRVFTLFDAWASSSDEARRAIVRGQALFNERALGSPRVTCSGCHNAPNVGSSSTGAFFDGVSGEADPALPLYTLRCLKGPLAGQTLRTTDPGWGLVTGRCADVGKFKVPALRALAGRAPYFHNGSAATLDDVIHSYDRRFAAGLSARDTQDLVAFLRAL
jgi:cytochrome c peroxidase